jgi:tetratricopeptide (TPR) repeat protein
LINLGAIFGAQVYEVSFDKRGRMKLKKETDGHVTILMTEATAKKEEEINAYIKSASTYMKEDQYDKAIEDLNKAIAIDPRHEGVYNNRGNAYSRKGQYDRAIEDYSKAIAIKPTYSGSYFHLALTYSLLGKESAACDSLNKAFEKADEKERAAMKKDLDDSDLDKIRNSGCFKKIVSKIKKK